MSFFKKILDFFINPRIWFLIPIALIAVAATVMVTLFLTQDSLYSYMTWGYVLLGVMAVTASYSIFGIIRVFPKLRAWALEKSENHPFWHRLFSEYGFRTILFTIVSLTITLAFAVYNGTIAIVIHSIWFGALAAYYVLLIIMRSGILIYHSRRRKAVKNGQSEETTYIRDTKAYGSCGIVLVLLPTALSFAVMQMILSNDSFARTGITIFVYAIYAFLKIGMAINNFIKARRMREMTVMAVRNINLADAFVSILALQTAMFREFGAGIGGVDIATMNAVTGLIVCVLTAAIGILMIINALRIIMKNKKQKAD